MTCNLDTFTQTTRLGALELSCDASDLQWAPGQWPAEFTLPIYGTFKHLPTRPQDAGLCERYQVPLTLVIATIYND
jgi:hypothetical protein